MLEICQGGGVGEKYLALTVYVTAEDPFCMPLVSFLQAHPHVAANVRRLYVTGRRSTEDLVTREAAPVFGVDALQFVVESTGLIERIAVSHVQWPGRVAGGIVGGVRGVARAMPSEESQHQH